MSNLIVQKFIVKSYLYQSAETFIDLNRIGNLVVGVYECPVEDKYLFH